MGSIAQTTTSANTDQYDGLRGRNRSYTSNSDDMSGTCESNIIYRNYFTNNPNMEHFLAGYRYTFNPDNRSEHLLTNDEELSLPSYSKTRGGIHTHTIMGEMNIPLNSNHQLRVGLSNIYRLGATNYLQSYADTEADGSMRYNNNLAKIYASYVGYIGKVSLYARLAGEYSYLSMNINDANAYVRKEFNILPQLNLYWMPKRTMRFQVQYTYGVLRPSVDQLNPYETVYNDIHSTAGNYELLSQNVNSVTLGYTLMLPKITLMAKLKYGYSAHAIELINSVNEEAWTIKSQYGNFGNKNSIGTIYYADYNPTNFLNLNISGSAERDFLQSEDGYNQCYWVYNLRMSTNFYLPKNWSIGIDYSRIKQTPVPYETIKAYNSYSLQCLKSFLNGRLTIGVVASNIFNKYNPLVQNYKLSAYSSNQTNWLIGRSFGLRLSYSISSGKQVSAQRQFKLHSEDLSTGVQ